VAAKVEQSAVLGKAARLLGQNSADDDA